ncbi:pirin family protein [Sneathiella glossodoripedis]|uniref:pirin family protein n=1 Tax=Sneathiella glossodoripedis TaxID=418853 RepID=UPI00046EF373|nr:pirin family protein [Sneathiella glossodoripedis]
MSNETGKLESECGILNSCSAISVLLQGRDRDLGGFSVRRLLPSRQHRKVGPWVFFDHMGPADFNPGDGVNVRPHPHIGLATVTYLFEGEMLHRDSLGTTQVIRPGEINLMASGSGIVHSERERPEIKNSHHRAHGLQLWLALPRDKEEMPPDFFHYSANDIPTLYAESTQIRVMMGEAFGVKSPVITFAETLYLEAQFEAENTIILPTAKERAIYVVAGSAQIGGTEIQQHSMAILSDQEDITLTATAGSKVVLIGGEAIEKRYMDWNFVSTRKERIEQAKEDWKAGRFAKIPGDDADYIPLPD